MALDNFSLGLSSEVESNFEFNSNTKQHEANAKRIQTDYNSTRFSSSKKLGFQNVDAKLKAQFKKRPGTSIDL